MASVTSNLVEVCVFRFRAKGAEVLLLRRAKDEALYPGLWQMVTGTVREGETSVRAAQRELLEETRLKPLRFWIVPFTSSFYDPRLDTISLMPVFAVQVADDALPVLSREHDLYAWHDFQQAEARLVWPAQRESLRTVRLAIVKGTEAGRLLEVALTQ
jgi:8-oxo-dGTP pyrophosphatase MutT (NUDIX family)